MELKRFFIRTISHIFYEKGTNLGNRCSGYGCYPNGKKCYGCSDCNDGYLAKKQKYIICSAIHFIDNRIYPHQPRNITHGMVVCGHRHHNVYTTLYMLGIDRLKFDKSVEGFLTNDNRFVNRYEATDIALKAKQIQYPIKKLYSENLY